MDKLSKFVVADSVGTFTDDEVDANVLRSAGLFKALSLLLASRNSVPVPPTLLLLAKRGDVIEEAGKAWHLPLMVRMDYRSLPSGKPLGGIPLWTTSTAIAVANFLFENNLFPLFHPDLDRFKDIYSVNLMMGGTHFKVIFEVVGQGFDASDLRLGTSSPHEVFTYDLVDDIISEKRLISEATYRLERDRRAVSIALYKQYTEYANKRCSLLASLGDIELGADTPRDELKLIPETYTPLTRSHVRRLSEIAWHLRAGVVNSLPASNDFVASLSLLPEEGWLLWDVYGQWYKR